MPRDVPAELSRHREALRAICERHGIARLELFGSAVRGDLRPDSDLDFLATFQAGREPGFAGLDAIEGELGRALGRPVDLIARRSIEDSANPIRRRQILGEAVPVFAAR